MTAKQPTPPVSQRVAIVTDANMHLGPDLALTLARRGHSLVLGDPTAEVLEKLHQLDTSFEAVEDVQDLSEPQAVKRLVDTAFSRFGRLDAACIRTGRIITGDILSASAEDLNALMSANIASVFHALQALLPPMVKAGSGQVVIVTSATGARAYPGAALYSATRAAANMMVKNAALSVAEHGVSVNAIGTNFLEYPGFMNATGATDPAVREKIEAMVPLRRLGQPEEIAHFCATLLDGTNAFQTGQFFSLSGGWSD
ncbi:MAG: SDR family NAD(P)-dependent oxidoreductase [Burkholderiaceae bacterium]